jgi:hypothetical protein
VGRQLGERGLIAAAGLAEQIFGLVPELLEVRTDGKMTGRHDAPSL